MNHTAICKLLALICILACTLTLACACTPTDTTGTTNDETTTADNTEETTSAESTYTVTVKDNTGAPVVGAIVQFNEGTQPFAITDANGSISVTAKTAAYTVSIVVAGYETEASYAFAAGETALNIVLTTEDDGKVDYTVKIMDANGKALEGVKVQLCDGDLCQLPVFTGADGIAIIHAEENDSYTVKITMEGYDCDSVYMFSDETNTLRVILYEEGQSPFIS